LFSLYVVVIYVVNKDEYNIDVFSLQFRVSVNCCTADGLVTPAAVTCSSDEFTCSSGECVELKYRCDRDYDCRDGSDEFDCRKYTD